MIGDDNKSRKQQTMEQIRVVQDILRRWDPMDLAPGEFAPADEYDTYAPHIVSLIAQGCSADGLAGHLRELRKGMVCMRDNPEGDVDIAREIVSALRNDAG